MGERLTSRVTFPNSLYNHSGIVVGIVLFVVIGFSWVVNADNLDEENNGNDTVYNKYYFNLDSYNTTWLMSTPPGDSQYNFTGITADKKLSVSQGIIDREYDPDITPEVNLFIHTHGRAGMVVNIQMEFKYFDKDNFLLEDSKVIAYFESYTTSGRTDRPEEVRAASTSYSDTPRDVPFTDYGAMIGIVISLEDDSENASIDLYCGKNGYRSNIITPYAEPYTPDVNGDEEGYFAGMERSCYVTAGIIVFVLVVIVLAMHYKDWKNKRD